MVCGRVSGGGILARAALTRIALDARETSHLSLGMIAYVRALRRWLPSVAPDLTLIDVGSGDNFGVAEQVLLPLAVARAGVALTHYPSPYVPIVRPGRYVMTIHDVIDLEYPQFAKRKVGLYYRFVVGPALRGAALVLTDDAATVGELERRLGVDPARVRTIALGADLASPGIAPATERPYLLAVGNHRPHKNLATLAAAWAALPSHYDVDLVLTGEPDVRFDATRERGMIRFTGAVDDATLRGLYAGAAVYVHPALREGFGLPMLEALREGAPVIASRSAAPRVLAPYVREIDALDVDGFANAIARVLDDPAAARAGMADARAAAMTFGWERMAQATAQAYREALQ